MLATMNARRGRCKHRGLLSCLVLTLAGFLATPSAESAPGPLFHCDERPVDGRTNVHLPAGAGANDDRGPRAEDRRRPGMGRAERRRWRQVVDASVGDLADRVIARLVAGDCWLWSASSATTKFVPAHVGKV